MHLGGLLGTQEASLSAIASVTLNAFFVLSNLLRASITQWLHAEHSRFVKFKELQ